MGADGEVGRGGSEVGRGGLGGEGRSHPRRFAEAVSRERLNLLHSNPNRAISLETTLHKAGFFRGRQLSCNKFGRCCLPSMLAATA